MADDEDLLRRAEQALTQIDRKDGLDDEHADVLAALRLRIYGAPKKTLDDALQAAGDIKGRLSFDEVEPAKKGPNLDDAINQPPKKVEWPPEPDQAS